MLVFSPQKLRAARGDRRAEAIAGPLGVTVKTIRNWETGRQEPTATRLAAIAFLLGKPLDWFFERGAA